MTTKMSKTNAEQLLRRMIEENIDAFINHREEVQDDGDN